MKTSEDIDREMQAANDEDIRAAIDSVILRRIFLGQTSRNWRVQFAKDCCLELLRIRGDGR